MKIPPRDPDPRDPAPCAAGQEAPDLPGRTARLLRRVAAGDEPAREELFQLLSDELRLEIARRAGPPTHDAQQATALVHETYLRLTRGQGLRVVDRAHFIGLAARAMRQILVDHARSAERAGGAAGGSTGGERIALDALVKELEERATGLVELDQALAALACHDERAARVVELRFFGGLSVHEAAEVLDVSAHTVDSDWLVARAWLARHVG